MTVSVSLVWAIYLCVSLPSPGWAMSDECEAVVRHCLQAYNTFLEVLDCGTMKAAKDCAAAGACDIDSPRAQTSDDRQEAEDLADLFTVMKKVGTQYNEKCAPQVENGSGQLKSSLFQILELFLFLLALKSARQAVEWSV